MDSHAQRRIPPAGSGAYPVREGNAVFPLVDGEPAFRRICQAVEEAETSVWVTVAFLDRDFEMPDGRGSFFDVLEQAARRGLDVRVLFWSEPRIEEQLQGSEHFPACAAHEDLLRERAPGIRARWDRVPGRCHHQKSWLVDAGGPGETAFVGGINLDRGSVAPPGHPRDPRLAPGTTTHDLYVEIRGPAATDVQHNFVQRWNEASERLRPHGSYPSPAQADDLVFPEKASAAVGPVAVQITRSVLAGLYSDGTATPDGRPHDIAAGEFSVLEQYLAAIEHAERTIYLENQLLLCPKTMLALRAALERGVDVVALVPHEPMPEVVRARDDPRARPVFDLLADLGAFPNFTLAGLAANRGPGRYESVYVHAKFAAVDDAWATIGSTNTMWRSFKGDTEMNASFWSPEIVRALRVELLCEHLAHHTAALDDRTAFRLYRETALENRERRAEGAPMRGLAFAIDPAHWAT